MGTSARSHTAAARRSLVTIFDDAVVRHATTPATPTVAAAPAAQSAGAMFLDAVRRLAKESFDERAAELVIKKVYDDNNISVGLYIRIPAPPTSSPVCSGCLILVADDACVERPREGMAVAQTTNSKQTARDVRAENPKPIGGLPHPKARRGDGGHSSSSSESSAATDTEFTGATVPMLCIARVGSGPVRSKLTANLSMKDMCGSCACNALTGHISSSDTTDCGAEGGAGGGGTTRASAWHSSWTLKLLMFTAPPTAQTPKWVSAGWRHSRYSSMVSGTRSSATAKEKAETVSYSNHSLLRKPDVNP
ncbi:hypothetical protein CYMTET_18649 [Cymbomonas tetramitiformis]|uniref:Uncharacterized protein n=1 Tax=Cymbomonas tetramitiformis TaxID=36881 RepID=A0AAE0L618_9CHLO|nr:hypothetical protein CYMTET_18649 [Cymbomonas tetramitiformis]